MSKNRNRAKLEKANSNKEYKYSMFREELNCPICPPNKGCNYRGKKHQRTWKVFRKTKWKEMPL